MLVFTNVLYYNNYAENARSQSVPFMVKSVLVLLQQQPAM